MFKLDDTSESEVALDSLGLVFNNLIDTDYCQDDTGASQAVEEEVNIISSDSEPLPRQKFWQVTWKVRFSHPLAYLDPHFLSKQQQHESRRQTRTSGGEDLSSGLPNTPWKCQNEVLFNLTSFLYQRVSFVNHSIPLIQFCRRFPVLPLAIHHRLNCRLSRPPLGKNIYFSSVSLYLHHYADLSKFFLAIKQSPTIKQKWQNRPKTPKPPN